MARLLSELLGASEPLFSITMQQLERASGNSGTDVRLTAEIIGKTHLKGRELGLDPRDSTGQELYHSLIGLAKLHDEFLAQKIGGRDASNVKEMLPKIKTAVEKMPLPQDVWVIKTSAAKKLLKSMPPKKVMKCLGYRSLDSMLKREPIIELYGAIRFIESREWLNNYLKIYHKLQQSDFETRPIEIIQLDPDKWGAAAADHVIHKRHNITHLKEMGAIFMLPMPVDRMPGITIMVMPLLIHYINELRMHSAYFKFQQMHPDLGRTITNTLVSDPAHHVVMAGQPVHWRIIQRHLGKNDANYPAHIFEPHLQLEDLYWRKAEEVLFRLEPALHYWHDMDYVGVMAGNRPISFNLMDAATNYVNKLPYEHRSTHHLKESLWNEIYTRYMGHESLENQVMSQLSSQAEQLELNAFKLQEDFI